MATQPSEKIDLNEIDRLIERLKGGLEAFEIAIQDDLHPYKKKALTFIRDGMLKVSHRLRRL